MSSSSLSEGKGGTGGFSKGSRPGGGPPGGASIALDVEAGDFFSSSKISLKGTQVLRLGS